MAAIAKQFVFDAATRELWRVAETGDTDALAGILSRGVDVNARNQHGVTALMRAAHYGHDRMVRLLLEQGADPNQQLFFKPPNVRGGLHTRGATPLIRAAFNNDLEVMKLLLEKGADATLPTADRQTAIHAVLAGRAPEPQAVELIKALQKAGADVNVVALINHGEEIRGGSALHYAVRKRYKEVMKLLASYKVDLDAMDQDGLTALDYTQSRGFMPFMALQTPQFKDEAALLRELGATKLLAKNPVWPVLGPPQGVWPDIWPVGEPRVHDPVYHRESD